MAQRSDFLPGIFLMFFARNLLFLVHTWAYYTLRHPKAILFTYTLKRAILKHIINVI